MLKTGKITAPKKPSGKGSFAKILSLALALMMILSLVPTMASFAAGEAGEVKLDLGKAVESYKIADTGDIADITDGNTATGVTFYRGENTHKNWIAAVVYDAGDGNKFSFNKIAVSCSGPSKDFNGVSFFGTDESVYNGKEITNFEASLQDDDTDYSDAEAFKSAFGLEEIQLNVNNTTVLLEEEQSYRYIVAVVASGWKANITINEIALYSGATMTESYYRIVNKNGQALAISTVGDNGAGNVKLKDTTEDVFGEGLAWHFYNKNNNGWYYIYNYTYSGYDGSKEKKHLVIDGTSTSVDAKVLLWSDETNTSLISNQWRFDPVLEEDGKVYYKIVARNSGLCVDSSKGASSGGIRMQPYIGLDTQLWTVEYIDGSGTADLELSTSVPAPARDSSFFDTLATEENVVFSLAKDISHSKDTALADGKFGDDWPLKSWTWGGLSSSGTVYGPYKSTDVSSNGNTVGVNFINTNLWTEYNVNNWRTYEVKIYPTLINTLHMYRDGKNPHFYYLEKESVETAEEDKKEFYIYEFIPYVNGVTKGDIAFYDDAHNFIAAYRYGSADANTITPERSFAADDSSYKDNAPLTYEKVKSLLNGSGVLSNNQLRMIVTNDEQTNTHTVRWYHKTLIEGDTESNAYVWTYFFGAVYPGTVSGLGRIEGNRVEASANWADMGMGNLKVYAGNYNNDAEAIDAGTFRGSIGVHTELPRTVTVNGEEKLVNWPYYIPEEAGTETLTGIIYETGQKVTATVEVVDLADRLTHYYSFDKGFGDEMDPDYKVEEVDDGLRNATIVDGKLLLQNGYMRLQNDLAYGYDEFTISLFYNTYDYKVWQRAFDFGSMSNNMYYTPDRNGASQFYVAGEYRDSYDVINKWFNIAATYKDGVVTVYKNGNQFGSGNVPKEYFDAIFNGNSTNYLGKSKYSADPNFHGYIDDVKIYNVALSAEEVAALAAETPYENYKVTAASALTAAKEVNTSENEGADKEVASDDLGIDFRIGTTGTAPGKITEYGFKLEVMNGNEAFEEVIAETSNGTDSSVVLFPSLENSNRVFRLTPYVCFDGSTTKVYGNEPHDASLYTEVIKHIADEGEYTPDDSFIDSRIRNTSAVIANGGFLDSITDLGAWRSKIIEAVPEEENTVKIKDSIATIGVGFLYSNGGIYIGSTARTDASAADGVIYTVLKLNGDGSITLSGGPELEEAVTVYLESIDLEFIQEVITETTTGSDLSNAADFQEIL